MCASSPSISSASTSFVVIFYHFVIVYIYFIANAIVHFVVAVVCRHCMQLALFVYLFDIYKWQHDCDIFVSSVFRMVFALVLLYSTWNTYTV